MEIKITINEVHIHFEGAMNEDFITDLREKIMEELSHCKLEDVKSTNLLTTLEETTTIGETATLKEKVTENTISRESGQSIALDSARANGVHPLKGKKAFTAALKICRKCGKEYKPSSNVQKDCDQCRIPKIKQAKCCKECGLEFFPEHGKMQYCSEECSEKINTKNKHDSYLRAKKLNMNTKLVNGKPLNPKTGRPDYNDPFN